MSLQCLYVDLDGTLLGQGASLLHNGEGEVSLAAVRALEAVHRVGAEVVIMSGRRKAQVAEGARLLGSTSYIYEVGSVVHVDGEEDYLTGDLKPGEFSIFDQIERLGVPQLLLESYRGQLEYHAPWHVEREVSHLFRGLVDIEKVNLHLEAEGFGALRLVDNGSVRSRSEDLAALDTVRAYHLLPKQASKAAAVARHMQIRNYDPTNCLAVGDSREDLTVASVVGNFWLVANALDRDPEIATELAKYPGARIADSGHGEGVYQAVVTSLMLGKDS